MIENKLALVWKDDEIYIAHPLKNVTEELYNKLSETFGRPVGRTEPFLNIDKFFENREKSQLEKILEKS